MKNNKGITLIALVITIIVMLILVGVTISMSVNGGLFEKAGEAVGKTNNALNDEQSLTNTDIIDYYVNRKPAVTALKAYSTDLLNEDGVLDENTKYESGYYTAVIPKGFYLSEDSKEQTIENGLVIKDITDNEFVWIPVKTGEFERTEWFDNMLGQEFIAKMNNGDYTKEELITKLATYYAIDVDYECYPSLEEALVDYNIIENLTDDYTTDDLKTFIDDLGYFSGDIEDVEDIKEEITNFCTLNSDYLENTTEEYADMVDSVNKYGGFYIGRYEAGSNNNRYTTRTDETVLVKKGAYPYNYVIWGLEMDEYEEAHDTYGHGAVYLSKNMYTGNTYGVTSTLCYGVQWDAALRFVNDEEHDVTNSTAWGNYYNSQFTFTGKYSSDYGKTWTEEVVTDETKQEDNSWLLTTGASEKNKAKNIYDLAGNVYEWTMEVCSTDACVFRGGRCNDNGFYWPASYRGTYVPDGCYDGIGFRPALYIK